jgi:pimeloyl-ACP methyl ester carboxylesterase
MFVHFWGGSARTWSAVASQLSTNFRCIAHNQRSCGQSDAPEQGYSIRDLALDAKHIVEALHLRRYVLVGHSMGGRVAQFLASQRPPGLVGLVLVAPAPPTPQNIPEPAKQAQLHAYDSRENALQALAFLTAYPPCDMLREHPRRQIRCSLLPGKACLANIVSVRRYFSYCCSMRRVIVWRPSCGLATCIAPRAGKRAVTAGDRAAATDGERGRLPG